MNAPPRVSVVIPFYNRVAFLAEAIESVLAQTYSDWELILVNDGSTDDSISIAKRYVAASPGRIHYLEHPGGKNRGRSASRNLGIKTSRGQYVAHLDSDDVWTTTKLEEQVEILDQHSTVAMTFAPMRVWCSWDPHRPRPDYIQRLTFEPGCIISPPDFVPLILTGENDPAGYLMRRSVFDEVGGYDEIEMCEDWALYIKIALKYPIHVARDYNYSYRQHSMQSCADLRSSGRFYSEFAPFFRWLNGYLAHTRCGDPQVLAAAAMAARRNRIDRFKEFSSRFTRWLQRA
jgi:glycosyltransferase involved in cell wall biosynthesis